MYRHRLEIWRDGRPVDPCEWLATSPAIGSGQEDPYFEVAGRSGLGLDADLVTSFFLSEVHEAWWGCQSHLPGTRLTGGPVSQPHLATSFRYPGVAAAYVHRPPYPREIFDVLDGLVVGRPRTVLDIGAGDGALARPLAERVDRVDAVEISAAMVDAGRRRPGGRRDNLTWYVEPVETMRRDGPYGLVTAGASLHWMQPGPALGQVARVLAPDAVLAVVDQRYHHLPWHDALVAVIVRYSRNPGYDPNASLPDGLARRGLFDIAGRYESPPMDFVQPTRDYIEQFHSTASLARELMSADEAARFDADIADTVRGYETDATLPLRTTASVVWGRPTPDGG